MEGTVRWGVIGSGGIARRRTIPEGIVPASNADLTAVFDVDVRANRQVAEHWGARAVENMEQLLETRIDAVYIATPAHLHFPQAVECAKAGKHILCEKPLGMNVAEAEEMVETARRAGVQLGTAFMMRFQSQHRAALDLIRRGDLGRAVFARAQLSCWYPPIPNAWRQDLERGGGGALIDMGGHCIDLLEMFFGPVSRVNCITRNLVHGYAPEDGAVVMLYFTEGALGIVDTFFCVPDEASKNALELYGSRGSILARGTIGQGASGEMIAHLTSSAKGYDATQDHTLSEGLIIAPPPVNTYRAEIEKFSQAVLEGDPPPVGDDVGIRSQKVLSACYESARSGCSVNVN